MNVILLMSGGVGNRFGANIPKQYVLLEGKPVIEYVLEACLNSKKVDKIVVVMNKQYTDISKLLNDDKIEITDNGDSRYDSLKNGLEYINNNLECDNILIADAVAPFIYPELIDDYFEKLDDYDIVLTGQKITGALCDFEGTKYDREEFFMAQAPEAFKFKMLYHNVDYNTKYQAISALMPADSKRYVNFNFKNNLKLTYNFELQYASFLLNYERLKNEKHFDNVSSSSFFITKGLSDYLLRIRFEETTDWLNDIFIYYKELINRYGIFNKLVLNQSSSNGLVMLITTSNEEEFVLKMIPKFIERYETEKNAYKVFSDSWMCELLDFDDKNRALFLRKLNPISGKLFDDNIKLTEFFNKVFANPVEYDDIKDLNFVKIIDNLNQKKKDIKKLPYLQKEVGKVLNNAIKYYKEIFEGKPLQLIHGDLRLENLLKDGNDYKAIDPIGYVAPLVMEPARFIISDVFSNIGYSPLDRLEILLHYFNKWFDYDELVYGLYIFFVMITYNSVYEYKTPEVTQKNLEVINVIEKEIISKINK